MSEVTLRQLEYFAAIAETQSITEAARRCHVSQAAVSLALSQLEQAVGGASLVIRRRGRGIALTAEGQVVAVRARQVIDQVADIGAAVDQAHGTLSGRLTVGMFRTLASHVIAPLLDWFTRHPAVELDFVEADGPEVQRLMLAGVAQLCVIYEDQALPDCATELLQPARRQAVLSPMHPLADQETVSLEELAPYPVMLMSEEPALQRTLAEYAKAGVDPNVLCHSGSVEAIHNVVGRNFAYSLLIQPAATSPEGRPLVFRPLRGNIRTNSVMAALPRGVARSTLVTEALTALHHHWERAPD